MRNITDYFYAFDSLSIVYEVANILTDDWGIKYYYSDEFRGQDRKGRHVSRINLFEDNKISFLSSVGLDCDELVNLFDELIEQCYVVAKNHKYSFADILCDATVHFEEKSTPNFMTGEEEANECNQQFDSMMNDNEAWSNIY